MAGGLEYDDREVARQERGDGYHDVTQVYPQYRLDYYTRSDDLRYDPQMPRTFPSSGRPRTVHDNYFNPESFGPVPLPYHGEHDHAEDNNTPLTLVLVRHLSESATEELFAKGLEKLYHGYGQMPESGAKPGSLKRIMIIRDRVTDNHMAFGYAEYHTIRDAQRAVEKAETLSKHGLCTIASKKIDVCFPNMGVFMPAYLGRRETHPWFTIELFSTQLKFKYKDERYYPSVHIVNPEPPYEPSSPPKKSAAPMKVAAADQAGIVPMESKPKKTKAPGAAPLPFLQHWQHKAAELREEGQEAALEPKKQPATGVNTISATHQAPSAKSNAGEQTFAHDGDELKACYLCNSEFKTTEGLFRHLKASDLHAQNLKDVVRVRRGYDRMKTKNIDPASTMKLSTTPPVQAFDLKGASMQYRDRAAERRKKERQTGSTPSKITDGVASSASDDDNDDETSKPSYGKGMAILQKAGWAEGQGLGTGSGITAPIERSAYAAGVGLGHEGSKMGDAVQEAEKMTRDGGFLEKTKEMARKRFEQME